MPVFESRAFDDHEQLVFVSDRRSGLRAIIALHDTRLGPGLGGCRLWTYDSEADAIDDALRLSRGMTYKNALAGIPFGGGKSVILRPAGTDKTPALMQAMGTAVDRLGGRYIVAEDVGTSVEDMAEIARRTAHVSGLDSGGGDPSPVTAYGTFIGLRASVARRLGRSDLRGLRVAVQGLGHVGQHLCRHLHEAGARLLVSDLRGEAVQEMVDRYGAEPVPADAILAAEADVFAPCALGGVIDDAALDRLKVAVVAGAANNQLAEDRHGAALAARGILYAPDYVINAGGVINVAHEVLYRGDYDRDRVMAHVGRIAGTLDDVFALADRDGVPTSTAADRLAEQRLEAADRPRQAA